MGPQFADAVDGIFQYVLRLLERLEKGEEPDPQTERTAILNLVNQADLKLGLRDEWKLSKYATVAWVDETLSEAEWQSKEWWSDNTLEKDLYGTVERKEKFFKELDSAFTLKNKDALEVFYVCLILGFQGKYRTSGMMDPNAVQQLETLAQQLVSVIQVRRPLPQLTDTREEVDAAKAAAGRKQVISAYLAAALLIALNVVVATQLF